jgi:hypothetical protein
LIDIQARLQDGLKRVRELRRIVAQLRVISRSPSQRRHAIRWLKSLRKDYLLNEPSPWITFDAIDFLTDFIHKQEPRTGPVRVFEYGSGGSTLFWQRHGARCVSIEHDATWFDVVRSRIDATRVDYRLITPRPSETSGERDPADPTAYASGDAACRAYDFRDYATAISTFPDQHFAIVLVDGRARPSCVMHAAPKVRPGGVLVLDNAEHEYYTRKARVYLEGFRRIELTGVLPSSLSFTRTDVYIRADLRSG